jgi:hypothetical protein
VRWAGWGFLAAARSALERLPGLRFRDVRRALPAISYVYDVNGDVLSQTDWHHKHEDVVSALGQLRAPAAVDALYHAAWWIPDYLDFDESRALAIKATWALGRTPGAEAEQALRRLHSAESEMVREAASAQLKRRDKP